MDITIQTMINAPVASVWKAWTSSADIVQWNTASPDWHTPRAENDLRIGGKFLSRMEARDGSMGFDFNGIYTNIKPNEVIEYTMEGGRKVKVIFEDLGGKTKVTETFEAENENPIEMQKAGWQAILDNFKTHVEGKAG